MNTCEGEKEEVWAKGEVSLQCRYNDHIAKTTRKCGTRMVLLNLSNLNLICQDLISD